MLLILYRIWFKGYRMKVRYKNKHLWFFPKFWGGGVWRFCFVPNLALFPISLGGGGSPEMRRFPKLYHLFYFRAPLSFWNPISAILFLQSHVAACLWDDLKNMTCSWFGERYYYYCTWQNMYTPRYCYLFRLYLKRKEKVSKMYFNN